MSRLAHLNYSHSVAVALGSNLGESSVILGSALKQLAQTPGILLEAQSPCYHTIAVGPPQPDYLNMSALFSTLLSPRAMLDMLLAIELQMGRVRQERWGPRLLDLDLLLFDDLIVEEPGLQIPHPRMTERAFVLVPLNDIAPNWLHPIAKKPIADLVQQVDCSGVKPFRADG